MKQVAVIILGFAIILLTRDYYSNNSAGNNVAQEAAAVNSEESAIVRVVEKATPSVATIVMNHGSNDQQDEKYNHKSSSNSSGHSQSDEKIGSGFIVTAEGLVVTNKHVVANESELYSILYNGKKYETEKIYRDPDNDIAILKIRSTNGTKGKFTPVTLGNSSQLKPGQLTIAIGTMLGRYENSVTTGIVSGLGRGIPDESATEDDNILIQTSAAINDGSSGGPLFDSSGRVVGINTASEPHGQNIGFAIPIDIVKQALKEYSKT